MLSCCSHIYDTAGQSYGALGASPIKVRLCCDFRTILLPLKASEVELANIVLMPSALAMLWLLHMHAHTKSCVTGHIHGCMHIDEALKLHTFRVTSSGAGLAAADLRL